MKSIKLHDIWDLFTYFQIIQIFFTTYYCNDICLYKCIPSNCDTATAILLFILVPFLLEAAAADLSVVLCKKKLEKCQQNIKWNGEFSLTGIGKCKIKDNEVETSEECFDNC